MMLAGDIETNPGPDPTTEENLSDISSTSNFSQEYHDNKNLNILHLNAESIRNKIDVVESESIGYDIVCITESWLNDSIESDSIMLTGFSKPYRKDRPDGYGGVMIYVSENLTAVERPDLDIPQLEAIWVEIKHPKMTGLFCSMYRPPKKPIFYWDLIDQSLENARSTGINHIFLLGDLNCNQLQPNNKLSTIFAKYNLTQQIKVPTYTKGTSHKCLDIIATNSTDFIDSTGTMPPSTSNHKPIYAILKLEKPKLRTYKRQIWLTKNVDWDKLNDELQNQNWEETLKQKDLNSMLSCWTKTFINIAQNHIKRIYVTVRPSECKWMTNEIRRLIRIRNRLHTKAKKKNTTHSWEKHKKTRNKLKEMIKKAKENYNHRVTEQINQGGKTNPRVWWSLVKQYYSKNAATKSQNKPLIVDGNTISNDEDKANALNNFFVEQTKLNTNGASPPTIPTKHHSNLNTINIKASTVKDMIDIINVNKSCGPDPISSIILKKTSHSISPILAKLFNYSIKSSIFPDAWKLAHVVPIHKKGDESQCKNFRPISLLPCLSKVFERCVFKDIFNYLHVNNRISKLQAAYSPCNSTEFQLLELYHLIAKAMDEKKIVRFVFCDVSKAFDRVWHEGLIEKLRGIGIGGGLLKWFRSYLSNRKQRVVINGTMSTTLRLHAGVPQGSILGPLLFLIYINDICDVVKTNIRLYADDSILFATGTNQQTIAEELNQDLARITKWAQDWMVTFNPNKTESLILSRKQTNNIPPLLMNHIPILEVRSHKHLGCHLDNNMKWNTHINDTVTKANRRVDILRGLKHNFNRKTLETLYKSFIRPILEYAHTIWNNCTAEQKQKIESVQLAALRAITGGIRGTSHANLYLETGFTTTYDRRERNCLIMFYKIYHGQTPAYLHNLLPPKVQSRHNYDVRSKLSLTTYKCNNTAYQQTFFPKQVKKWNELDSSIKFIGSLQDFKKKLRESDKKVPKHYYTGVRKWQLIHTRMRLGCSPLRDDLHTMKIIDISDCDCGHHCEDVYHFFFVCPNYAHIRNIFHNIHPSIQHTVSNFLYGKKTASLKINQSLFETVQTFIKLSNRF